MMTPYGPWGMTPQAVAYIQGSEQYPHIRGMVYFCDMPGGTQVCAQVWGLPPNSPEGVAPMVGPFFAFHLHAGKACAPRGGESPFSGAEGHYNPPTSPTRGTRGFSRTACQSGLRRDVLFHQPVQSLGRRGPRRHHPPATKRLPQPAFGGGGGEDRLRYCQPLM